MLTQETGRERFERAVDALGKPQSRGNRFALFNMDCIDGMRCLQHDYFDLCVTSPPYNIGKEYEDIQAHDDYVEWCEVWLAEIYKVVRQQGAFWLNLGYNQLHGKAKALPLAYTLWDKVEFYFMQEVIWNYGAGVSAKKFLSPRNEKFLWYVKDAERYTFNLDEIRDPDVKYPNQKKNGKLRCNSIGKNPSDVWQIAKVTSGTNRSSKERTPHPAQFPLDLVDRIVKGFSNSEDVVLDPFMGSGTTAVSSVRHGRYVIGFETNTQYCADAGERIKDAENDLLLL